MNKKEKSKWVVLEEDEVIHVLPETDIKPHGIRKSDEKSVEVADLNCPCKPRVDAGGRKPTIIHNSFEDIELIENSMSSLLSTNNK